MAQPNNGMNATRPSVPFIRVEASGALCRALDRFHLISSFLQGVASDGTLRYVSRMENSGIPQVNPLTVVNAWQQAVNLRDVPRLLELSAPNIEIVGPRGSGFGHQLLSDWVARAGLNLVTLRAFVQSETVILAQHGVWRSVESGEVMGEADLASQFIVSGGRVEKFVRYEGLDEALNKSGLRESDEKPLE